MNRELSKREKVILGFGGAFCLMALILFGILEPYQKAMKRLDTRIASRRAQVESVRSLHAEGIRLKALLGATAQRLDSGGDASLLSTLETVVSKVARKENLLYMKPQQAGLQGEYRETAVELKIEKIDLAQLVRFLQELEGARTFFVVKRMQISRRYDDSGFLDAVMTVSSYRKAS